MENSTPKNPRIITQPKEIQLQIFEKIEGQNAIIFMETGKGKTYLSIMVIKDLFNEGYNINSENSNRLRKVISNSPKVIFLVCEVALVLQQAEVIKLNTGLKVKEFRGGKMQNLNDYEKFRDCWQDNEVFISTPNIIYKFLSIGYLKIGDISLIIFDECHHCNQDHPYNLIMNEFYFYNKIKYGSDCKLPRILGLTASPLKTKIGEESLDLIARNALSSISENLDSYIILDPDAKKLFEEMDDNYILKMSDNEAKKDFLEFKHFLSTKEYEMNVDKLLENLLYKYSDYFFKTRSLKESEFKEFYKDYKNYLSKKFESPSIAKYNETTLSYNYLFRLKETICYFNFMEKITLQIFFLLENISMQSIFSLLDEYIKIYKQSSGQDLEQEDSNQDLENLKQENLEIKTFSKEELSFLINTTENFVKKYSKELNFKTDKLSLLFENLTKILQDEIKNNKNFDEKIEHKFIIFVESRVVSKLLNSEINRFLEEKFGNETSKLGHEYKSISIVGVSDGKSIKGKSIKIKNTEKVMESLLNDFRDGKAQIMVATSTVEEGLDIKDCDNVFVYGNLRTVKSYIQMKGRARRKNAKFVIFTENAIKSIEDIQKFAMVIIKMREQFQDDIKKDFRNEYFLNDKKIKYPIYPLITGAKLSIKNSKSLFNEIWYELIKNGIKIEKKDKISERIQQFGNEKRILFKCVLNLESDDLDDDMKEIISDDFTQKDITLSHCYLIFIQKLHENEVINDYLKYKS